LIRFWKWESAGEKKKRPRHGEENAKPSRAIHIYLGDDGRIAGGEQGGGGTDGIWGGQPSGRGGLCEKGFWTWKLDDN